MIEILLIAVGGGATLWLIVLSAFRATEEERDRLARERAVDRHIESLRRRIGEDVRSLSTQIAGLRRDIGK